MNDKEKIIAILEGKVDALKCIMQIEKQAKYPSHMKELKVELNVTTEIINDIKSLIL